MILPTLATIIHASDVQNIYGEWVPVAFYPVSTYVPICLRYSFNKNLEDIQCTCADEKNTVLVLLSDVTVPEDGFLRHPIPMLVVDKPGEEKSSLNVTCRCGDNDFKTRVVARTVNENYLVMYEILPDFDYTEMEPNTAYVFAKTLPLTDKLSNDIASIDELSKRNGAIMCTKEYYDELKKHGSI